MTGKGVDYWNSVGDSWSRHRQKLWRAHSDAVNCALIARWLPQAAAGRVLKTDLFDEMCSEGLYPLLAPLGPLFVGIDLSGKTLRAARARHQDIQAVAADVLTLPFAEGTFDLIISTSTLDHFESPAAIADSLAELFRVLRPGGRMIITMDNPANPLVALRNSLPFRLLNLLGVTPYYFGSTCDQRELQGMLTETGFTVLASDAVLHCPRVFAVAAAHLLEGFASLRAQRAFLRILISFERLRTLRTRNLTGHFIAALAIKQPFAHPMAMAQVENQP